MDIEEVVPLDLQGRQQRPEAVQVSLARLWLEERGADPALTRLCPNRYPATANSTGMNGVSFGL